MSFPRDTLCSKRYGSGYGKPLFPAMPQEAVKELDLTVFISEDSWSFFIILKLDHSFLYVPVDEWECEPSYINIKEI